jgi:transcriptional regulator with XRE-family HTH domain
MILGDRIREILKNKNISQTKLAESLGVSRQVINQYLNAGSMTTATLEKIAEAIDVPVICFYNGSNTTELQVNYTCLKSDYEQLKEEKHQLELYIIELQNQLIKQLTK